jgi:hypothetical protein
MGRVTATENTYGLDTGHHPHKHVLLFLDASADLEALGGTLGAAWVSSARETGLTAKLGVGLDLRGGERAGQYVGKLGLEVALAVCKLGRTRGRLGVWELLAESHGDPATWQAQAFIEFARTMKGRKHLVWSKGLKDRLLIEDVTDDEIMDGDGDDDERLLAVLTRDAWRSVQRGEVRGELLQCLGILDVAAVERLLLDLGISPVDGICWM